FVFYTNHVFDRTAHVVIKRFPSTTSIRNFNTNVQVQSDTTYQEVLNTRVHVYSTTNVDHPNRSVVKVNPPKSASYLVFWIAADEQAVDQISKMTHELANNFPGKNLNPLAALGLNIVTELPMFHSVATVSYDLTDDINASLFRNGRPYSRYKIK